MSGIFINGRWHENTDMICRRCGSPVWKSDLPQYEYQCLKCDEDLFSFEAEEQNAHYLPRVFLATHFEGITINPLAYLQDDNHNLLIFDNQIAAELFLTQHGYSGEDLETVYFVEIDHNKITCLNCGHEFMLAGASVDSLGAHTTCEKCGTSFDIDLPDLGNSQREGK